MILTAVFVLGAFIFSVIQSHLHFNIVSKYHNIIIFKKKIIFKQYRSIIIKISHVSCDKEVLNYTQQIIIILKYAFNFDINHHFKNYYSSTRMYYIIKKVVFVDCITYDQLNILIYI